MSATHKHTHRRETPAADRRDRRDRKTRAPVPTSQDVHELASLRRQLPATSRIAIILANDLKIINLDHKTLVKTAVISQTINILSVIVRRSSAEYNRKPQHKRIQRPDL